jgi:hypothetical protein
MDYETLPAPEFGRSFGAISDSLLVRDVLAEVVFPIDVFNMQAHRASGGLAIVLHADHIFGAYPLRSRAELRLELRQLAMSIDFDCRQGGARIDWPQSLFTVCPATPWFSDHRAHRNTWPARA